MEGVKRSPVTSSLKFPIFSLGLALSALALLVAAGFGSRFGLWHFRTGFALLKYAAFCGIVASILALCSAALAGRRKRPVGVFLSVLALAFGVTAFVFPYSWKVKAQRYPRIHDISTDLTNPPQFVAVAALRKDPVAYGGAAVASQQLQGYPDLRTLVLSVPADRAFNKILETAKELRWEIVAAVPAQGRIEATDTTFWFGFKDDIVIRIFPAGERSLIDVRSVSRVGISDVGTNARRIRTFFAKLSHQGK